MRDDGGPPIPPARRQGCRGNIMREDVVAMIEGRCGTCSYREDTADLPANMSRCALLSRGWPICPDPGLDVAFAEDFADFVVGLDFGCVHWSHDPSANDPAEQGGSQCSC